MEIVISPMESQDWQAVAAIYAHGLTTRNATFETQVPTWEHWNESHLSIGRLVARHNDTIVGWAALSPVSKRHVYRGVVEESIYIAPDQRGNGIGKLLLSAVIEQSEAADIWTIQTSIFPENKPSLALHERCGFRVIGQREKIGQLDGVWRDVFFLERRSTVAGI